MATSPPMNVVKDEGGTFIPASQRPDGTWRKPRRVKDGYVPQEEVPLYESKGKQWAKSKPGHVVGMGPSSSTRQPISLNNVCNASAPPRNTIPGLTISPADQAAKSKKKKKKKAASTEGVSEVTEALQATKINWPTKQTTETTPDPTKRLKNLKKRLREVELLEQKINSGELKNPDKDQLEKVKRKEDLKEQIADLEFELSPM